MAKGLTSKSAVVTGSDGGIGSSVALALATEGAKVIVNYVCRDANGTNTADKVVEALYNTEPNEGIDSLE
jgi:3-oxoacyl-[acyl-carrier protein] reductase